MADRSPLAEEDPKDQHAFARNAKTCRIGVVSDIHYACIAEQDRGDEYELRSIRNPVLRLLLRTHRNLVWMHDPLRKSYLLDRFLSRVEPLDLLVANGDYSCDSAFVGVSDPAAQQSVAECLGKLRSRFGENFRATIGDHELGKRSLIGGSGGMRLSSWTACQELNLESFWQVEMGKYLLVGIVSSLVALPVFRPDTLPGEWPDWERLREAHLARLREVFGNLRSDRRVLLFCHDPTALPFLKGDPVIGARLRQIEQTFVGHLHTDLVMRASSLLSRVPGLRLPGHTGRRMSAALREARHWRDFNVRLCPALAGIELLKDGGHWVIEIDPEARAPARFEFHRLPR